MLIPWNILLHRKPLFFMLIASGALRFCLILYSFSSIHLLPEYFLINKYISGINSYRWGTWKKFPWKYFSLKYSQYINFRDESWKRVTRINSRFSTFFTKNLKIIAIFLNLFSHLFLYVLRLSILPLKGTKLLLKSPGGAENIIFPQMPSMRKFLIVLAANGVSPVNNNEC